MSRGRWVLWLGVGLVTAGAGAAVASIGLETADKISSVVGAACGVLGLGVSIYALLQTWRPPANSKSETTRSEDEEQFARVRDVDPRHLGVHAAIAVSGTSGLPKYVPRDIDTEVRAALTAGETGCFLLLVGDSSVGKTRTLHEAVLASHPDRRLIHPLDGAAVNELAKSSVANAVIWLDELQRYLGTGLSVAPLRTLLARQCVIVGTLWPIEYSARTVLTRGSHDAFGEDRAILDMATVIKVPARFSDHEQRRAEDLATSDPRLRLALDDPDGGMTQVLSAGPALVHWWENSPPFAAALITAAADARRMGINSPATQEFLRQAAPGYLTTAERAAVPEDWLEEALRHATTRLHGALAALNAVGDKTTGNATGYLIADYLAQHCLKVRRSAKLPDTAWTAMVQHVKTPGEMLTVAMNARHRLRFRYALPLFRRLAAGSNQFAGFAASEAAGILSAQGENETAISVLRPHAAEDPALFASLLLEGGRLDELTRIAAHSASSAEILARHLAHIGRPDDAIAALLPHTDNWGATDLLVTLLSGQHKDQECMNVLTPWAEAGHAEAQELLWGAAMLAGLDPGPYEPKPTSPLTETPPDPNRVPCNSKSELTPLREVTQVEALWDELEAGRPEAATHLMKLLVRRGEITKDQVDSIFRFGLNANGDT